MIICSLAISILALLVATMPYWETKIRIVKINIMKIKNNYYQRKYNKYYNEYKALNLEDLNYKKAVLKFDIFFSTGLSTLATLFIFAITIIVTYSIAKDSMYLQISSNAISESDSLTKQNLMEVIDSTYDKFILLLLGFGGILLVSILIVTIRYGFKVLRLSIIEDFREMKKKEVECLFKHSNYSEVSGTQEEVTMD
jgi:beta-lactamase regulating signal transducer with metallopeptidase domain